LSVFVTISLKQFLKESCLTIITYLEVTRRPNCGQEAIAMAADGFLT